MPLRGWLNDGLGRALQPGSATIKKQPEAERHLVDEHGEHADEKVIAGVGRQDNTEGVAGEKN